MKKIFLALLLLGSYASKAQNRQINFEGSSLAAALIKAKASNKLTFVDCFTVWCIPCKNIAATVFKTDSVADYFNSNFINVQLDMEKGEGPAALKKYRVEAFPSFLLLDGDGNMIYKFVGGMNAAEFMSKIKEGENPANKIAVMNKMYADGNRSKEFLREYIKIKIDLMENSESVQIADAYFNMLSAEEKALAENWFLFGDNRYAMYLSDVHSRNFSYLADHWSDFVPNNGKEVVEARLCQIYRKITEYCLHGWYFKDKHKQIIPYNKADFDNYRRQIRSTDLKDKAQFLVLMDIAQAYGERDTLKVSRLFEANFNSFSKENQRLVFSYLTMFGPNERKNEKLGFRNAIDKMIRTAKDEKVGAYLKKTYAK